MTNSQSDRLGEVPPPRGRVRRRIFWSMLGVASVAMLIAGIVAALVGQNIVGRQVRTEMVRQAVAVENLLGERLLDEPEAANLIASVLQGDRDIPTAISGNANRGRALVQLVGSARRLFGSPLVDIAFADAGGSMHYLTASTRALLGDHVNSAGILTGRVQFVTVPASAIDGDQPLLVHVRPVVVAGFEESPVRMAIVVARQSTLLDMGQVLSGTVSVRVRPVNDDVELSVADMGSGIDPGDLPNVYEKFYVARHYRRVRPEGSGLGLSIVKQLVDSLGGHVVVTSEPDHGTTFRVRLPSTSPTGSTGGT